jgi:stalled ribosome rescue protein Dom34
MPPASVEDQPCGRCKEGQDMPTHFHAQDMPTHFHAIVWIDHSRAKVFHVGLSGENEIILHPHLPTRHLHHKANSIGSGHVGLDKEFFAQVMNAVSDAGEILVIGPASAKTELARYLRDKHPQIADRVVAVEAVDHPSDAEIVAYAKRHFKIAPARVTAMGGSVSR